MLETLCVWRMYFKRQSNWKTHTYDEWSGDQFKLLNNFLNVFFFFIGFNRRLVFRVVYSIHSRFKWSELFYSRFWLAFLIYFSHWTSDGYSQCNSTRQPYLLLIWFYINVVSGSVHAVSTSQRMIVIIKFTIFFHVPLHATCTEWWNDRVVDASNQISWRKKKKIN